jgi:hypothetical protein
VVEIEAFVIPIGKSIGISEFDRERILEDRRSVHLNSEVQNHEMNVDRPS